MSRETRGYRKLFAEPQGRQVFRPATIYGARASAVLQLAHTVAPSPGLPPWSIAPFVARFANALRPSSSQALMVLNGASALREQ